MQLHEQHVKFISYISNSYMMILTLEILKVKNKLDTSKQYILVFKHFNVNSFFKKNS